MGSFLLVWWLYSNSGVGWDAFCGLTACPVLQSNEKLCVPSRAGWGCWRDLGNSQELLGGLTSLWCLQCGALGLPAAVLFPDRLRGMKRPFKTAGRGLG